MGSIKEEKLRDDIIAAFEKQLPRLKALPVTSKKRNIIKTIIVETLEEFPEGTKLPSVRAMSAALGVTIVSVHKAVRDLASEGYLITKSRTSIVSGVKSQKSPEVESTSFPFSPFEMKVKFRTDSGDDYQRKMWGDILNLFNSEHPTINAAIDFASYRQEENVDADVMECAGYGWNAQVGSIDLLPVRRFVSEREGAESEVYGDMHIPLYYRSYFLFYNQDLLDKCGISHPQFINFNEQLEYLANSEKACCSSKLEGKPFSITHPVTLLGSLLPVFLDYVKSEKYDDETRGVLAEGFGKILSYLNSCKFDYNEAHIGTDYELRDFLSGSSPFFIGTSSIYWQFKNQRVGHKWAVYPLFSVDNNFVKWPVVGMVSRDTKAPIESVKFLSFLRSDEIQSKFLNSAGMIPANMKNMDGDIFLEKGIGDKFITDFDSSQSLFLKDESDYYLVNSVLNSEFWSSHLKGSENGEELLERALFLARAVYESRK